MAAVSRSRCRATRATRKGNKASHGPPHGFFSSPKRLADLPHGFFGLQSGWRTSQSGWRTCHTDFSASKAVGGPPIRIFRPPKRLADLPYGFFGLQSSWRTSHTDFSAPPAPFPFIRRRPAGSNPVSSPCPRPARPAARSPPAPIPPFSPGIPGGPSRSVSPSLPDTTGRSPLSGRRVS